MLLMHKTTTTTMSAKSAPDEMITATMAEERFPVKLHAMLTALENEGQTTIASWLSHGYSFRVHDQERFMREILPTWFKQTKPTSFIRQLNLYCFRRITSGPDAGSYYHQYFLRGFPSLSHRIERVKVKGKGARQPSLPTLEPNFYLYEPLPANEEEFARMTERRRQQQQQEQQQQRQQRMGVARLRSDPSSEHKSSHERLCSLISQNPSSDQVAREPREDATWRSAPNPGTTPLSSSDAETLAILRRLEALRASQQAGGAAYAYPSQASLLSPTSPLLREAASLRPLPLNPAVQNSLTSHLLLLQAQQDEQIRQLAFLSHATAANAASASAAVSTLAASAAARGYAPNNAAPSLQPNETSLTLQLLERLRNLQQRDNQR